MRFCMLGVSVSEVWTPILRPSRVVGGVWHGWGIMRSELGGLLFFFCGRSCRVPLGSSSGLGGCSLLASTDGQGFQNSVDMRVLR